MERASLFLAAVHVETLGIGILEGSGSGACSPVGRFAKLSGKACIDTNLLDMHLGWREHLGAGWRSHPGMTACQLGGSCLDRCLAEGRPYERHAALS